MKDNVSNAETPLSARLYMLPETFKSLTLTLDENMVEGEGPLMNVHIARKSVTTSTMAMKTSCKILVADVVIKKGTGRKLAPKSEIYSADLRGAIEENDRDE